MIPVLSEFLQQFFALSSHSNTGGELMPRETRHTVFFTPLYPCRTEEEAEYCRDLTKPRKVLCKTEWKHSQKAVRWIHLGSAQEKGTAF